MSNITQHEGKKYLRQINSADTPGAAVGVDVYAVLEAFGVTCPARQHAIKKLLCAGGRGKGDTLTDLKGALAAVSRAIELETGRPAVVFRQKDFSFVERELVVARTPAPVPEEGPCKK